MTAPAKKPPKPAIPYHELFPLNEGESSEDHPPLPPDQIRIIVRRYDQDGIKRAQRLYPGTELRDVTVLHSMFGRGFYELEGRTTEGRFYRRVQFKIDGDPPKPLDAPTTPAPEAAGMISNPVQAMPAGSMGGGPFEMMMVMMQNMFGMMMQQSNNSTTLLAAVLGKQNQGTDPAIAAVIASLTELSKTRIEVDARGMQAAPATPEQDIARLNSLIALSKTLSPTVPPETITQTVKDLWPVVGPTVGPILGKIVEAGAATAARAAPAHVAQAAAVPLPDPVAPAPG